MKKLNPDIIKLEDILSAIDDVESFSESDFTNNKMAINAIAYSIAIIGEASNKLSVAIKEKHNYIPWADIVGIRHRIVHDYGNVSVKRLKEVVDDDVPILKEQINKILKEIL